MGMAASMAAMMAPTAAPFLIAYGRDTRRPAAVALIALVYLAVWALIGAAVDVLMSRLMMPSSWLVVAAAFAFAAAYAFTPWSRFARARCRAVCRQAVRGESVREALTDGSTYTACCVLCSTGVTIAIAVIGMSNVPLVVLGAAVLLVYKIS